jgi:hypothetical protein
MSDSYLHSRKKIFLLFLIVLNENLCINESMGEVWLWRDFWQYIYIYKRIQLFEIKGFSVKSGDRVGPLFGLLGMLTNVMAAAGLGKSHTAAYISVLFWFASVALCRSVPGLWEWCGNLGLVLVPVNLGLQYFWNSLRHGETV